MAADDRRAVPLAVFQNHAKPLISGERFSVLRCLNLLIFYMDTENSME